MFLHIVAYLIGAFWAFRLTKLKVPLKFSVPLVWGLLYSIPAEGRFANCIFTVTIIAYVLIASYYASRKYRGGDDDDDDEDEKGDRAGIGERLTEVMERAFRREAQQATAAAFAVRG